MREKLANRTRIDWIWAIGALTTFSIPLYKRIVPLLLIVMAILSIVNYHKWNAQTKWVKMGFISIYALLIVGLSFTMPENMQVGFKELEVKMSYFAVPLLFFVLPNIDQKWLRRLLDSFTIGVFCFIIFSLIRAGFLYGETGRADQWTYYRLAENFHPTYMAFYCSFALGWLLMRWNGRSILFNRSMHFLLCAILIIYITLLASKAGLITAMLTLGWAAGGRITKWAGLKVEFLVVIGLALLLVVSSIVSPASKRVEMALDNPEITQNNNPEDVKAAVSSSGLRLAVWKGSWTLIKAHPLGLGTGNVQTYLNDEYLEMGEVHAAKQRLNAHNQYFQITLEHGIFGLLLFLLVFGILVVRWFRIVNQLGILLIGLLLFNMIFESFMERQEGIIFTIFFLCLLAQKNFTSYEFASSEGTLTIDSL